MKQYISIFLACMLCLSMFAGCDKQDTTGNNGINTEYEGIYLTLISSKIEEDAFGKEYTTFNLRLHNETDKNGEYDARYFISSNLSVSSTESRLFFLDSELPQIVRTVQKTPLW